MSSLCFGHTQDSMIPLFLEFGQIWNQILMAFLIEE
jgi:hypothetical protein